MKIAILLMFLFAAPVDPTFKQAPKGWTPVCPAGTDVVRHEPKPDCLWGSAVMSQKPTQGDFECVAAKIAVTLPACPKS